MIAERRLGKADGWLLTAAHLDGAEAARLLLDRIKPVAGQRAVLSALADGVVGGVYSA